MPYCSNCGSQLADGTKFCPFCGAETVGGSSGGTRTHSYMNGRPVSHQEDVEQNKIMAVLAYLGILVLVPLFAAKDSPYARFHANQGLVLLIASVVWNVAVRIVQLLISAIFFSIHGFLFAIILNIANVAVLVFIIMGIVNAVQGEEKELPLIGHYRILK